MTGAFPLTYTINNTLGMVYGMGQTLMGGAYTTGNGTLATITFNLIDDIAPIGPSILNLTDLVGDLCQTIVVDRNGDECTLLSLQDGEVHAFGDVNGDGNVLATDLAIVKSTVTKVMLGTWTTQEAMAQQPFADLSGDGQFLSTDVAMSKSEVTKAMM